jgi:flagellar basal body-associated protein FliL
MEQNIPLATELIHELKMAHKRLFIIIIVLIVSLIASWGGFIWYATSPDLVSTYEIEQSADGNNALVGVGDLYGGEAEG